MKAYQMLLKSDLQERTQHGSRAFPIQYYVDELHLFENRACPLHWHSALEFFVVQSGAAEVQIGDAAHVIAAGDGVFLNMNALHSFRQVGEAEKCDCPNIVFSDEFLAPANSAINEKYVKPVILNSGAPYILLKREIPWQAEVLQGLDIVFSLLQKYGRPGIYGPCPSLAFRHQSMESACYEIQVQTALLTAWSILYAHIGEAGPGVTPKGHRLQIRMQKMLGFVHEHYRDRLTIGDIANAADVGKSECFRCFGHYLQTSPVKYLISYRIERAKKLLQSSHDSIETVAAEVGFDSATYFCRVFKRKTGMTAKQYRAQASGR